MADNPELCEEDQLERARALLFAHIDRLSSYHAQKETMTWGAATLYVAAVAVLLGQSSPFWANARPLFFVAFAFLLAGTSGIAFMFVHSQYKRRDAAHYLVNACVNVLSEWVARPPAVTELQFKDLRDLGFLPVHDDQRMPAAVLAAVETLIENGQIAIGVNYFRNVGAGRLSHSSMISV